MKTIKPHLCLSRNGPSFVIRPATATDAHAVGILARQFADYLRELGDTTEFKLTAEAYLRDGFGPQASIRGIGG